MSDAVEETDRRLAAAVEAVRGVESDDLPDELADDVREAFFALLAAKGRCEVREVSAE
jgi:hypothetical protein